MNPQDKTILIVEDEYEFRFLLRTRLEKEGFQVVDASNGQEALEILKQPDQNIHLILLDMFMPVMDGVTFYYHLTNTLNKKIPVVILTNFQDSAHQSGVKDYIIKSNTDLDELVRKVKLHVSNDK